MMVPNLSIPTHPNKCQVSDRGRIQCIRHITGVCQIKLTLVYVRIGITHYLTSSLYVSGVSDTLPFRICKGPIATLVFRSFHWIFLCYGSSKILDLVQTINKMKK